MYALGGGVGGGGGGVGEMVVCESVEEAEGVREREGEGVLLGGRERGSKNQRI